MLPDEDLAWNDELYPWGSAQFVGEWTRDEVVQFARRVAQIQYEERERAAGARDE